MPRVGMLCREDPRAALALRECYEEPTAGYGHDREEVVSQARGKAVCICVLCVPTLTGGGTDGNF